MEPKLGLFKETFNKKHGKKRQPKSFRVCGLYSISFSAVKTNWARKICINTQINVKPAQYIGKMRRKAFKIEFKQIHTK